MYTVDKAYDEFGKPRYFVADELGDWIAGPFDTYDLAASWIRDNTEGTND